MLSRLTELSLLPMRSFLVPTFEKDLVRISDVHLDGFGQPSCNRLIGFATRSKKLECQNPIYQVFKYSDCLGLGFGEVPLRFDKCTTHSEYN